MIQLNVSNGRDTSKYVFVRLWLCDLAYPIHRRTPQTRWLLGAGSNASLGSGVASPPAPRLMDQPKSNSSMILYRKMTYGIHRWRSPRAYNRQLCAERQKSHQTARIYSRNKRDVRCRQSSSKTVPATGEKRVRPCLVALQPLELLCCSQRLFPSAGSVEPKVLS